MKASFINGLLTACGNALDATDCYTVSSLSEINPESRTLLRLSVNTINSGPSLCESECPLWVKWFCPDFNPQRRNFG